MAIAARRALSLLVGSIVAGSMPMGCASQAPSTPSPSPTATSTPSPTVAPSSQAPTADELARSVVQIQVVQGEPWGSGTVISDDGLILTNAHVATPDDVDVETLYVAVTDSADVAPTPRYVAEVLASDVVLDLALIRATGTIDGEPYEDGAVEPVPIGDSDDVHIGDDLLIFGYPGIGGDTITFTRGLVSGFTSDDVLGDRAWFKTDATIAGGNSGGLAANAAGQIVGIPTQAAAGTDVNPVDCRPMRDTNRDGVIDDADDCVPIGGFLNGVRPVNLAQAMLDAVQSGTAYEPIAQPAPPGFDVAGVDVEQPLFTDVEPTGRPAGDTKWIPSGATSLCAWWEYAGMADGIRWDAIWALEGVIQEGVSYVGEVWTGGEQGDTWVCVVGDEPVEEGLWDLTLNVEDEWVGGGFVVVGDERSPVDFTFANESGVEVCYLYVSPEVMSHWGSDWLGQDVALDPGEEATFSVPPATYDLRGTDCDHVDIFTDSVDVTEATTFTYR
jgi:S1-C subfamily serine protease